MYTNLELICTIISLLNLSTSIIIYLVDRNSGISINSGKNYKSFKICITMSILFGVVSMCLLLRNINVQQAIAIANTGQTIPTTSQDATIQ